MESANPTTRFNWDVLDINGVAMRGIREKQGHAFSRHGYIMAQGEDVDPDRRGADWRRRRRPNSGPVLLSARGCYELRTAGEFPHYFIVEPTTACNRECPFCTRTVLSKDRHATLPFDQFTTLMNECAHYPVYGISLYGLGEPFLYRSQGTTITTLVGVARLSGFEAVNLSTNGDVDNLASILDDPPDDLIFSVDGITAETYARCRPAPGGKVRFRETQARINRFLFDKVSRGSPRPWVRMQIINWEATRDEIDPFIRFWIDRAGVDDVFVKELDSMHAWLGNAAASEEDDRAKAERVASMPCQHIYAVGSVLADGRYCACCHDPHGTLTDGSSIDNSTFAKWWQGEYMNALRARHEAGDFPEPCASCRERDCWLG